MSDLELMAKLEADSGDMIRTAELSRQLGYDRTPEAQKRIRFARDRILAHHARLRLISEWLSHREFEEERIEQYYEQEWTATIDPLLDYDALVVLVPYDDNKTEQEQQETLEQARERANELIAWPTPVPRWSNSMPPIPIPSCCSNRNEWSSRIAISITSWPMSPPAQSCPSPIAIWAAGASSA